MMGGYIRGSSAWVTLIHEFSRLYKTLSFIKHGIKIPTNRLFLADFLIIIMRKVFADAGKTLQTDQKMDVSSPIYLL